jgi:hypothetical protein
MLNHAAVSEECSIFSQIMRSAIVNQIIDTFWMKFSNSILLWVWYMNDCLLNTILLNKLIVPWNADLSDILFC